MVRCQTKSSQAGTAGTAVDFLFFLIDNEDTFASQGLTAAGGFWGVFVLNGFSCRFFSIYQGMKEKLIHYELTPPQSHIGSQPLWEKSYEHMLSVALSMFINCMSGARTN